MSEGRRNFLKMFGLTGAAFARTSVAGTTVETVTDKTVEPLTIPLVEPGRYGSALIAGERNTGPEFMDVQKGRLYSAQEFQRVEDQRVNRPDGSYSYTRKTLTTGSVSPQIQFFHYDRWTPWEPSQEATLVDTNMYRPCMLTAPEAFAIQQVGIIFSPLCGSQDRSRFIETSTVEVWLGQKLYARYPLSMAFSIGEPKGKGPFPEFPVTGMIDLRPLPLILEHGLTFFGQIHTKPAEYSQKLRLWMVYEGLHARGVC